MKKLLTNNNGELNTIMSSGGGISPQGFCGCGLSCYCKKTGNKSGTDAGKIMMTLISPSEPGP